MWATTAFLKHLANGGSNILNVLGHRFKQWLEGFGSFNHVVIACIDNAFWSTWCAVIDITIATGSCFHQILDGINVSIIWSIPLLLTAYQRTCEVNRMGENSSFIFIRHFKTVPVYGFKLVWVVLHPSVKEFFKTIH